MTRTGPAGGRPEEPPHDHGMPAEWASMVAAVDDLIQSEHTHDGGTEPPPVDPPVDPPPIDPPPEPAGEFVIVSGLPPEIVNHIPKGSSTPDPVRRAELAVDSVGRDGAFWPYPASSYPNQRIKPGRKHADDDDPTTHQIISGGIAFNYHSWSTRPHYASPNDPIRRWFGVKSGGEVHIRVPDGVYPAGPDPEENASWDGEMVIVSPDRRTFIEGNRCIVQPNGDIQSNHLRKNGRLDHDPWLDTSIKSSTFNGLSGLVQPWHFVPRPGFPLGGIPHVTTITMKGNDLQNDLNEDGQPDRRFGWQHPAKNTDNSAYLNTGNIPMGALLSIPRWEDVEALGLNAALLVIARSWWEFGTYVSNRSGNQALYASGDFSPAWVSANIFNQPLGRKLRDLKDLLRMVTNNGPDAIGGPGVDPLPQAPPLKVWPAA